MLLKLMKVIEFDYFFMGFGEVYKCYMDFNIVMGVS